MIQRGAQREVAKGGCLSVFAMSEFEEISRAAYRS